MSIGPSQPSSYILPASIAGAVNRNLSETNQARGDQSVQNLRASQDRMANRDVGDVLESGLSADRDVDGRLPYDLPPEEQAPEEETDAEEQPQEEVTGLSRSHDEDHERGNSLDLDA